MQSLVCIGIQNAYAVDVNEGIVIVERGYCNLIKSGTVRECACADRVATQIFGNTDVFYEVVSIKGTF